MQCKVSLQNSTVLPESACISSDAPPFFPLISCFSQKGKYEVVTVVNMFPSRFCGLRMKTEPIFNLLGLCKCLLSTSVVLGPK